MTPHLTPQEFTDAADGVPSSAAARHLATCPRCGHEVSTLGTLVSRMRALEAPAPSPLFWDHFSRRVQLATASETMPATLSWGQRFLSPLMAAVVSAVTVAVVMMVGVTPFHHDADAVSGPTTDVSSAAAIETGANVQAIDHQWDVMVQVASDLSAGELQQVARPTSDATAAMIDELTPAQRGELVQLIKTQMGRGSE